MHKLILTLLFSLLFQGGVTAGQGISLANDYQKNSGLQWEWAMDSLKQFSFNPEDKVLDIGCGDGKITALIAAEIPNGTVIGLDISEKMIKLASSLHNYGNLLFLQGNATELPFKEQFDKVVSFCTLHWILDQKKGLKSMKNALKGGGKMLLVFPGKSPNNLATLAKTVATSPKWSSYFPNFKQERIYPTPDEYRELLIDADLEINSLSATESITHYKNKDALINWLKPLVNFIEHLSVELRAQYIQDLADQMIALEPLQSDGSICVRDVKIEVIATKR